MTDVHPQVVSQHVVIPAPKIDETSAPEYTSFFDANGNPLDLVALIEAWHAGELGGGGTDPETPPSSGGMASSSFDDLVAMPTTEIAIFDPGNNPTFNNRVGFLAPPIMSALSIDYIADAVTFDVSGPGATEVLFSSGTLEPGENDSANVVGSYLTKSLWPIRFIAPRTGVMTWFCTDNDSFNGAGVEFYRGNTIIGGLEYIGRGSSTNQSSQASTVNIPVNEGDEIHVRLASSAVTSTLRIGLRWLWLDPADVPSNDFWENAIEVDISSGSAEIEGTTVGATVDYGPGMTNDSGHGNYNDVWYTFTSTVDGVLMMESFTLDDAFSEPSMYLWIGESQHGGEYIWDGSGTGSDPVDVTAGTEYHLNINLDDALGAPFRITLEFTPV